MPVLRAQHKYQECLEGMRYVMTSISSKMLLQRTLSTRLRLRRCSGVRALPMVVCLHRASTTFVAVSFHTLGHAYGAEILQATLGAPHAWQGGATFLPDSAAVTTLDVYACSSLNRYAVIEPGETPTATLTLTRCP